MRNSCGKHATSVPTKESTPARTSLTPTWGRAVVNRTDNAAAPMDEADVGTVGIGGGVKPYPTKFTAWLPAPWQRCYWALRLIASMHFPQQRLAGGYGSACFAKLGLD